MARSAAPARGIRGWGTTAAAAAVVLSLILPACAGRANGPSDQRETASSDDREWQMEGVIAAVEPGPADTRVTVDVSGGGEPGRAVLLVSAATEVTVRGPDGTVVPGGVADLTVGARIAARHTGVEMRSLPPQYRATHVRVIRGG